MPFLIPTILLLQAPAGIASAAAGQRLLSEAIQWLRATDSSNGAVVAFDVSAVEVATTSFFKTSVLPLYQSGRLSTEAGANTLADAFGLPTFDVFPLIVNATVEVEALADEIFGRRGYPLLSVRRTDGDTLHGGRMVGYLDEALVRTLRAWDGTASETAATLRTRFPEQEITQTAWSNRLNDLWRARLLRRVRQGKSWSYQPLVNGISYG